MASELDAREEPFVLELEDRKLEDAVGLGAVPPMMNKSAWQRVTFGDVAVNVNTNAPNPLDQGLDRYVGLDHLDPEDLRIKRWGNVADGITFTRVFRAGQVLFGKRRAYQRKVAVADFDGVCSGDILVFEAKLDMLVPELLPFIVQSEGFFQHALGTSAGSLSPRTKWAELAKFEFALPPKDEQRRIAEVLWAAEEAGRSYEDVLSTVSELSATLASEFFGANKESRVSLADLVRRGSIEFQTGPFGTILKASSYKVAGIPVINQVNIVDGKAFVEKGPFVDEEEALRLHKYTLRVGDIVLSRNGEMGKVLYVSEDQEGYILGSNCLLIRCLDKVVLSEYLAFLMASPHSRRWLETQAQTTTMAYMNEKTLGSLEIKLPDIVYQLQAIATLRQVMDQQRHVVKHRATVRHFARRLRESMVSEEASFLKGECV